MPMTQPGGPPSMLDAPPPSPAQSPPPGLDGLVRPPGNGMVLPPDVLTGMMQTASAMGDTLDQLATMTKDQLPKIAQGFGMVKDLLQRIMADLALQGAGPTSPQAPGPQFPGGGMSAGQPGS